MTNLRLALPLACAMLALGPVLGRAESDRAPGPPALRTFVERLQPPPNSRCPLAGWRRAVVRTAPWVAAIAGLLLTASALERRERGIR